MTNDFLYGFWGSTSGSYVCIVSTLLSCYILSSQSIQFLFLLCSTLGCTIADLQSGHCYLFLCSPTRFVEFMWSDCCSHVTPVNAFHFVRQNKVLFALLLSESFSLFILKEQCQGTLTSLRNLVYNLGVHFIILSLWHLSYAFLQVLASSILRPS